MKPIELGPSFLRADHPYYNLFVLSQMHREQRKTELCTAEVFKALPPIDASRLGLKSRAEAENDLGDAFLVAGAALGALAIWTVTAGLAIHCAANRPTFSDHNEMPLCFKKIGEWWTHSGPIVGLTVGAATLGTAYYFHRAGWLGKWLFDSSSSWREAQMRALYRDAAWELEFQTGQAAKKNDAALMSAIEKIAVGILQNSNWIQVRLIHEVQLTSQAAEKIVFDLRTACQKVLKKDAPIDLAPLSHLEKSVNQRLKELVENLRKPWRPIKAAWSLLPQGTQWRNEL